MAGVRTFGAALVPKQFVPKQLVPKRLELLLESARVCSRDGTGRAGRCVGRSPAMRGSRVRFIVKGL
jgi:hypothetical protein